MNKELLAEEIVEITISQTGKTEENVYQNIFNELRKEVHSRIEGYLVEMHVESFILLNEDVETSIKKFLFFFMPVEHKLYKKTAKLIVRVKKIQK